MNFLKIITFLMVSCLSSQTVCMSAGKQKHEPNRPIMAALLLFTLLEPANPVQAIPSLNMSAEHAFSFDNTQPKNRSSKKHARSHACKQTRKIHNLRKQTSAHVHQPDKNGKRTFPGKNAKK
ncbi:MAG: hypothetical protein P4L31_04655 [Candidatus Babeliales bacterium]|nr:hypothetical protein [Candidatus Babeliales bacterium]